MSKFKRIIREPEICWGAPTIQGTLILVLDILDWIKEGKSFESKLENFPTLLRKIYKM